MQKIERRIVIEPLSKEKFQDILAKLDEEVSKKKVSFSKEEAVKDDLYD